MRTILDLLHLQIDNKTDILKTHTPTKMAAAVIKVIVIIVGLTLCIGLAFARVFTVGIRVTLKW